MTWWCSAQNTAWSWSWQPYPGVWLVVAFLAIGHHIWARRLESSRSSPPANGRRAVFLSGVAAVWLALDWPVGALGAGYLLSAHQLQYVLLVMVAPPLLLLGGSPAVLRRLIMRPGGGRTLAAWLTRPLVAVLVCNVIVVITHLPGVIDWLMPTQVGSFVVDMSWLLAGVLLWWPAIQPVATPDGLGYPGRFGYLLLVTVVPGIPSAFFFFADYPLYSLYELAPPVDWISVMNDQFLAGIIMKFGSFAIVIVALSVLFYRWHRVDQGDVSNIVLPRPARDVGGG